MQRLLLLTVGDPLEGAAVNEPQECVLINRVEEVPELPVPHVGELP